MYTELSYNELQDVYGGVNGWLIVGGSLVVVGGVAECCTVAFTASGVATIISGVGMIVAGVIDE